MAMWEEEDILKAIAGFVGSVHAVNMAQITF